MKRVGGVLTKIVFALGVSGGVLYLLRQFTNVEIAAVLSMLSLIFIIFTFTKEMGVRL